MQEQLRQLIEIINEIGNDPKRIMGFVTLPMSNTNLSNKPPDNIRMLLIQDILLHLNTHEYKDITEANRHTYAQLDRINTFYQSHQHLCWISHTSHFHKALDEYVNCPMTCLHELHEYLTKMRRVMFTQ